MEVTVLRATDKPERLVCRAARGDYFDGFVGDTSYEEIMSSVSYDEQDRARAEELRDPTFPKCESYWEQEAATRSFIDTQLDRGHYGPWEHPQITIAVKGVSRSLMAQATRHRHMSFDVQSQRYVDFSDTDAILPESLDVDVHVSRETGLVELDEDRDELAEAYRDLTEGAFERYEELVAAGVPKEDARFLLPIGTPVNMTFSGNARTMMHFLNMRQKADAQWEIRNLSDQIASILDEWMPYTGAWWRENGPMKLSP